MFDINGNMSEPCWSGLQNINTQLRKSQYGNVLQNYSFIPKTTPKLQLPTQNYSQTTAVYQKLLLPTQHYS